MSMIFPGMDPYLEAPWLWPEVHASLIIYTRDFLQPQLRPRYVAAVEGRLYVEGTERSIRPDASVRRAPFEGPAGGVAVLEADAPVVVHVPFEEIQETYIAILDRHEGLRVVTVLEIVSPKNKAPGPGRDSYRAKQREVLSSDVHLVEIDLLRHGVHALAVPQGAAEQRGGHYDYLISVNRAGGPRDAYELYPRKFRDRLPRIRIPLAGDDPDVVLDVQDIVTRAYEAGSYQGRIDYAKPPEPPLSGDDRLWAEARIRAANPAGP